MLAPITVFRDGLALWVADGFHRTTGATQAGLTDIDAEVHPGDKRDAILYSCGAIKHGKARTNEDKRRAVGRLLTGAEWSRWSNVEVARHFGGSEFLVRSLRSNRSDKAVRTYRTKHDTTAVVHTCDIGLPAQTAPDFSAGASPDDLYRAAIETAFPVAPSPARASLGTTTNRARRPRRRRRARR